MLASVVILASAPACDRLPALAGGQSPEVAPAELQAAATDPAAKAFYEARQWQPAWNHDSARALEAALDGAPDHGLDAKAFKQLIRSAEGDAARDAELTLAAIRYARALSQGAVDPRKIHADYAYDRPEVDLAAGLRDALQRGDLGGWLNGLAPQDEEYKALSKAYVAYWRFLSQSPTQPVAAGPVLTAGQSDPRVPAIAERLAVTGYLPVGLGADQAFTRQMADAVKALQSDARIPKTGRVDAATVAALNAAPAERMRQLAVNLERRRWLPRNPPATRIDVNTASAEFVYLRDGQPAWSGKAVVGSPEHQTPLLGGAFTQLVVNPPWNVPRTIAAKEILPKGADYMAKHGMYVQDGKVVQRAGPDAALGAVKFDMQNPQAIYLHDTPAKSLFASAERHRSHGCVRVEKAVEFARFLAEQQGKAEAFDKALATGETQTVSLGTSVPVRLMYNTAFLDSSGKVMFADDPYGWDDAVGRAMGLEPSHRSPGGAVVAELGP